MRMNVDGNRCQGHARCHAVAPNVFEIDDLGFSVPGVVDVPAGDEDQAAEALRACPERAISELSD